MSDLDKVHLIACLKEANMEKVAQHAFAVIHEMDSEIKSLRRSADKLEEDIAELKKAFPDTDIHGHRLYHERLIRSSFANESVKNSVKADLIQKAMMIIVIAVAAFFGIKSGLN
jgi:hypothetical protein